MAQFPNRQQPGVGSDPVSPSDEIVSADAKTHTALSNSLPWLNLPQFLLFLAGISLVVASQVNLPRHLENRELEELHQEQEAYARKLEVENSLLILQQIAVESDPFYRKQRLRRFSGQAFQGGTPLGEWLEFQQDPRRVGPGGPSR